MDRGSIIGLALLIIVGIVVVNYFHIDCSRIADKGATINQSVRDKVTGSPEGAPMVPQPSMKSAPVQTPKSGDEEEHPGINPPIPPPPAPPSPGP